MHVALRLTGSTPLMAHNVQLADPDNPVVRQIAAITSKRSKTPEDRAEIGRLEWLGSLYTEDGQVVMPSANIRRCVERGAALRKLGAAVTRGLIPYSVSVPLAHDGPAKVSDLAQLSEFQDHRMVTVSRQRVVALQAHLPQLGPHPGGRATGRRAGLHRPGGSG